MAFMAKSADGLAWKPLITLAALVGLLGFIIFQRARALCDMRETSHSSAT